MAGPSGPEAGSDRAAPLLLTGSAVRHRLRKLRRWRWSGGSTAPAAATVEIKNYAFNPTTVTIQAGQTVQWNFDDNGVAHNVIGDDGMHTRGP